MRDAGREVSLYRGAPAGGDARPPWPPSCSAALTRPSEAAVRAEAKVRLQEALNGMDPIDREVLALRHFEELTNAEAAQVLGHQGGGRQQALRPGPEAAQGRSWPSLPGGLDGAPTMSDAELRDRDPLERAGRGVRSSGTAAASGPRSTSTPTGTPSWPSEIRELFPALVVMERVRLGRTARPAPLAGRRPAAARRRGSWATTASSARSAGAAWGSSTRPSRSRSAGTWR